MEPEVEDTFDKMKARARAVAKKSRIQVKTWVKNTIKKKPKNEKAIMSKRMNHRLKILQVQKKLLHTNLQQSKN
jgi:hypothetical protein